MKHYCVEVYSDNRLCDSYQAWSNKDPEELEDAILDSESWDSIYEDHYSNWVSDFDGDEEEEIDEWASCIGPHVTDFEVESESDEQWLSSLPMIWDERETN